MYEKNKHQLQIPLTSYIDELVESLKKRLETSWASVFFMNFSVAWTKDLPKYCIQASHPHHDQTYP